MNKQIKIKQIESKIKLLQNDLEQLKQERDEYVMRVDSCISLTVYIDNVTILFINESGEMYAPAADCIEALTDWHENGCKCSDEVVKWTGKDGKGEYMVSCGYLTRMDIDCGVIYNFLKLQPISICKDPNIKTAPYCGTPICY